MVCDFRVEDASGSKGLNLFEGADQRITSSEIARVRRSNSTNLHVYGRKNSDYGISRTSTSFEKPYGADTALTFESDSDQVENSVASETNDSEDSQTGLENDQNQNDKKEEDSPSKSDEKPSPKRVSLPQIMGMFFGLNLWVPNEKSLGTFWGVFEPTFQVWHTLFYTKSTRPRD